LIPYGASLFFFPFFINHLSNPMELWINCKHIIKKHLRYLFPSSCLFEPGKECIFNKTTYNAPPALLHRTSIKNWMALIQLQSFRLIHLNSFKIITIYSKFIQITRIVFHFSERFILKVKTKKTKIILPLAICKLSSFLLLFVSILRILKKRSYVSQSSEFGK
jgi:hypothetical protein